MQQLSRQERLDWLQLIRTRNVGPATFSDLIGHFGNAADALAALPDFARRGGSKGGFKLASRKDAERELDRLDALGAQLIASCEASYPRQLANCEAPPPLISLKGHPHLLHPHLLRAPTTATQGWCKRCGCPLSEISGGGASQLAS